MKKSIIILLVLILTFITLGCSSETAAPKTKEELKEEIRAEMGGEKKAEEKEEGKAEGKAGQQLQKKPEQKEQPKQQDQQQEKSSNKLSVKENDSVFEYISLNYPDFSREDYDKWTKTYLDITGNGEYEVVFSATYGDGGLDHAIILTSEEGSYREISKFIGLDKYGNDFEIKDGFLVHKSKTGGSGFQQEYMGLYYYGGHDLESVGDYILLSESVGNPKEAYDIKSEIEGSLMDFVITYTKEDTMNGNTEVIAKDKYTFDDGSYIFWHTPLSVKNTAKSFGSVYNGNNFAQTLTYYNENLYFFGENERKEFSQKIIDVINEDKENYFNHFSGFLEGYANLYNKDTNKFDVTGLNENDTELVERIKDRKIYSIVKVFYTTEGAIDDCGFGLMLNPWEASIVKTAYNDVTEKYNINDYFELEPFYVPQIYFSDWISVKAVTKTNIVYPNVYVSKIDDVYRLEGEDTWKTNILLPIELTDKKGDNEPESETVYTNKENYPTSEIVNGENINYGDYYTVIIAMYQGIYSHIEEPPLPFDVKEYKLGDKTKLHFAVFGELNLGGFTVIQNMGDEGTFHHVGETIKDSMVNIYCDLPNDFSSVKVTGSVYIDGENYTVEFTLDDMRDYTEYKVLKYK